MYFAAKLNHSSLIVFDHQVAVAQKRNFIAVIMIKPMIKYSAFLRGINVGGHRVIKMEYLRRLFGELGLQKVQTYIQSGNIFFESEEEDEQVLITAIEKHLLDSLGYEVPTFLRTPSQMASILENYPFTGLDNDPKLKIYVAFLPAPPPVEPAQALMALNTEWEKMQVYNREVYIMLKPFDGKSIFSNNLLEKKLKMLATTRNWATVNKMS